MKTKQELAEMAENANKKIAEGFQRILPHISGHKTAQELIFEGLEELNNVIKGYQAAQEDMKWISVEDMLPDEKGNYLVFYDDEIFYACFSPLPQDETGCTKEQNSNANYWWINENTQYSHWAEKFTGHDSNDTLLNPTHWMHLPQKPLIP